MTDGAPIPPWQAETADSSLRIGSTLTARFEPRRHVSVRRVRRQESAAQRRDRDALEMQKAAGGDYEAGAVDQRVGGARKLDAVGMAVKDGEHATEERISA
jgi:hypothetical protein